MYCMKLLKKWGDEMTNNEVFNRLLALTEENARLKAALNMLKYQRDKRVEDERTYVLEIKEADAILSIAGMADKEIEGICFDNDSEIAYVP